MTYGSVQRAYWLSFYPMGCVTFGSLYINHTVALKYT
jgi:hypothetical protein